MRKVLVIGIDGASWDVLNPMIQSGCMPRLQHAVQKGFSGTLLSTEPPITPTAWTSFQTGLPAHQHNVLGFRSFFMENGRFRSSILFSSSMRSRHIWRILSDHGRRVCILNLPLTYPPFPVNGILVSGFPVPSGDAEYTFPPEFKEELHDIVPGFEVMQSGIGADQKKMQIEEIVDRWSGMMSQKARLAIHLLRREPWDVFMVHIQESDLIQHYLWPCMDPSDPAHRIEDFVRVAAFYSRLDRLAGEIIDEGNSRGFSVMLLSDHGFQRCRHIVKINNWLHRKGCLVLRKDAKRMVVSTIKRIMDLPALHKWKSTMKHSAVKAAATNQYLGSVIDYEKTVAFVETNATHIAFLHLLTADSLVCNRIIDEIKALTDPGGAGLVRTVSELEGPGNRRKIVFADGVAAAGIVPDGKPWLETPIPFKQHVGMHHRSGVIILDDTFEPSRMPREIFKVPALIMSRQRIPFDPLKSDGRMTESLEKTKGAFAPFGSSDADKERGEVEEQLRGLGYL